MWGRRLVFLLPPLLLKCATAFECYYQIKVKPHYNLTALLDAAVLRRLRPMRHDYALNQTVWVQEPVQLFRRGSSWHDAWSRNLDEYTAAMASNVAAAWAQGPDGGSYDDGLLQVDYEPQYRPIWAMQAESPATKNWLALLASVHNRSYDVRWLDMVGYNASLPAGGWKSLNATGQDHLAGASWDYFVRAYLTQAMQRIKAALPSRARFGNWNWPFKKGIMPTASSKMQWLTLQQRAGWLWQHLGAFYPDVYPEAYVGPLASRPAPLSPHCANWSLPNATENYFGANIDIAQSLQSKFQPTARLVVAAWYHYMCDQHAHTPGEGPVAANDGNVAALFAAVAAREGVGISLWGSVGGFKGEDPVPAKVAGLINKVWGPHILQHCDPPLR
jgi:hypothetical protein